jgi:hypothetical protein
MKLSKRVAQGGIILSRVSHSADLLRLAAKQLKVLLSQ